MGVDHYGNYRVFWGGREGGEGNQKNIIVVVRNLRSRSPESVSLFDRYVLWLQMRNKNLEIPQESFFDS